MPLYLDGRIWDHRTSPTSRFQLLRAAAGPPASSLNLASRNLQETPMRRFVPSATLVLILGASATAPVAADDLVPPGARLELLYTRTRVIV
jgi:hypothetical protein